MFASDLDRTLIYSQKVLYLDGKEESKPKLVETLNGKQISFMTEEAIQLLKQLMSQMLFVPVTTRTLEQYKRIQVFQNECKPRYAVTTNGAVILKDGVIDEEWKEEVNSRLNKCLPLKEVWNRFFLDLYHVSWVLKSKTAEDTFIYHIIDPGRVPMEEILIFEKWLSEQNWRLSLQGRKLYFVPNVICKGEATKYIQEKEHQSFLFAAGDSKLDHPLLKIADQAFCPQHGELYNHSHLIMDHMFITETKGIVASEEILKNILEHQTSVSM